MKLPTNYFFGFSAATGDLADNHDIVSVKVFQLDSERKDEKIDASQIIPQAETFAEPRDHVHDDHPSKVWTVFKWIFIIIFSIVSVVALIFGVYWFVNRQQRTKKRFY